MQAKIGIYYDRVDFHSDYNTSSTAFERGLRVATISFQTLFRIVPPSTVPVTRSEMLPEISAQNK